MKCLKIVKELCEGIEQDISIPSCIFHLFIMDRESSIFQRNIGVTFGLMGTIPCLHYLAQPKELDALTGSDIWTLRPLDPPPLPLPFPIPSVEEASVNLLKIPDKPLAV